MWNSCPPEWKASPFDSSRDRPSATSNVDIRFFSLFSFYDAFWFDFAATGASVASSSASFNYSGVYNGSPVVGTGTATLSSFDPGGQPRDFRLNFGNSLPAAGTFTALTVIPTATFNNPVNYGNIVAGMIPAAAPNTNSPLQIQVIPEPQVGVLVLAGIVILGLRRRRS